MSGVELVRNIRRKISLPSTSTDYRKNVQSLIDRVLNRGGVNFSFQPIMELIDFDVKDDEAYDAFEIDQKDGQVVLRYVEYYIIYTAVASSQANMVLL